MAKPIGGSIAEALQRVAEKSELGFGFRAGRLGRSSAAPVQSLAGEKRTANTFVSSDLTSLGTPARRRRIHFKETRIAQNDARESRGPVATIKLFEALRTEVPQATHLGRNNLWRECARVSLCGEVEVSTKKKWIADCEIA
jgi:hypothetical protein